MGLLTLLVISYLYLRFWKWTYFGAKGLFQVEPSFPFGNFNDVFIWVTKLKIIARIYSRYPQWYKIFQWLFNSD